MVSESSSVYLLLVRGREQHHSNCSEFLRLTPKDRHKVIIKSNRSLNCLRSHLVKDCALANNCRKCGILAIKKHYYLLTRLFCEACGFSCSEESRWYWRVTAIRSVKIENVKALKFCFEGKFDSLLVLVVTTSARKQGIFLSGLWNFRFHKK